MNNKLLSSYGYKRVIHGLEFIPVVKHSREKNIQCCETDSLRVDYMLQIAKSHIELGELEQSKYFLNAILNIKVL